MTPGPRGETRDERTVDRRRFLAASAAAGGIVIAGCLDGDDADDVPGEEPDDGDDGDTPEDALTLMTYEGLEEGDPTEHDEPVGIEMVLNYLIEEFEEETGIEVEHQSISIEEWRTQGPTIVGASDGPVVSETMGGPGEIGTFISEGHLLPLDNHVDESLVETRDVTGWQFEDGNLLRFGSGEVYGIPHYMSGLPLWFNVPVLEEAGVDYERLRHANDVTLEEFEGICEDVLDAGYTPLALGNRVGGHIPYMMSFAVNKTVGHEEVFDVLDPETDRQINDEEFVDALGIFEDWWQREFINDDTLALDEDEGQTYFFQNEAAFMSDGIWIGYLWDAVSDPDDLGPMGEGWDYMWWPYRPDVYEEGRHELLGFNVGAYSISSTAEEQGLLDEAIEWLDFYMSEETAEFRAEHMDRIPSHEDVPPTAGPVQEAMHADLTAEENVQAWRTDVILLPAFGEALRDGGQSMLEGDATPQEVLDDAQEALESAQEQHT